MVFRISLAAARVNAGLTQTQVAQKLGKSKSTIINWENGKNVPSITDFRALCALYNCPEDRISVRIGTT